MVQGHKRPIRPLGLSFASALKTVVYPKPSFEVPLSLPEHSRPRYRSSRSTKENDILASSKSLPNHRRGGAVVSTVGSRTLVGSRPATLRPKSYTRPLGESRSENHAVGMSSSNSGRAPQRYDANSEQPKPTAICSSNSLPSTRRRRSFPSSRKSTAIPTSKSAGKASRNSRAEIVEEIPDLRSVDSFGRKRKTIAHSPSQGGQDSPFSVDLSPIIEDIALFPPLTTIRPVPSQPTIPPKSGLRRVTPRANDSPESQDDDLLHEDPSIPALLLTFPTPELPHSPILAPQLPFRLPYEDDIRPDSQALALDDKRPLAHDNSSGPEDQEQTANLSPHQSISHNISPPSPLDASGRISPQDSLLEEIVTDLIHRHAPNDSPGSRHLLSPSSAPPSPPRCTYCGFGFGYSLALADMSSASVNRSRASLDVKRSSSRSNLAGPGNRLYASSSSIASFNSAASSVVPLKTEPCDLCAPQWSACKDWYAVRGRRLRDPASQNAKKRTAEKKSRWTRWEGKKGKAVDETSVEHKSQWFSDSMKKSRSVNEFGVMRRPWGSAGQSAPAASGRVNHSATLGGNLSVGGTGDVGRSASMDFRKTQRTSAQSDASVLRRIRRLFVAESRSSKLSSGGV